jgi:hypothetical protein
MGALVFACQSSFHDCPHRFTPEPFNRSDYKTLGLRPRRALEIYDFIIFVFFALTLSQLFFPPEMPEWLRLLQSFGIFVTGYLASAGRDPDGAFRRPFGPQEGLQPEHPDDGVALPADRNHADLRANRLFRPLLLLLLSVSRRR